MSKGIKVAHNLDDFIENHEVILTLEDKPIIVDGKLNENGDVLENLEMKDVIKG